MGSSKGTVKAKWVGTFIGEMTDGTELIPGETVVEIGRDEAEASDHWQVQGAASTPTKGDDD